MNRSSDERARRRTGTWLAAAALAAGLLGGTVAASHAAARRAASSPAEPALALPVATDGEIAVRNMDAEVASLEARVGRSPDDIGLREALVAELLTRGEFLGSIADYERATDLAEDCVGRRPGESSAYLTRASARAALHRFDEASADLDRAEALAAKPRAIARARAAILAARGRLEEALSLLGDEDPAGDPMALASRGLLLLEMGRTAGAARLLQAARAAVRDTSPLPCAWIDYQEAALAERLGDRMRARALYERAHALLPRYAAAAAHLAAYLDPADSVPMLAKIAERSDDPETSVALAAALRARGDAGGARLAVASAARRYDELTSAHPAAFADHAARFWLGPGDDPEKARGFALANLASRPNAVAVDLALTTALATGRAREACDLADRALGLAYADDTLRTVATAVMRRCGT